MRFRILAFVLLAFAAASYAQVKPINLQQLQSGTVEGQIPRVGSDLKMTYVVPPFIQWSDTNTTIATFSDLAVVAGGRISTSSFADGTATFTRDNGTTFTLAMSGYWIPLTQKGAINGVAPLGADGKISSAYLPAQSVADVYTVNSEAAMLALAATQGDIAVRSDGEGATYILQQAPASTLANWVLLPQGAGINSVNGQSGSSVTLTTDNISEGAVNKYFSIAAVRASLSALGPIDYNNGTGVISLVNSGVAAGTYNNITVNEKGIATAGSNVAYLQASALAGYVTETQLSTPNALSIDWTNLENVPENLAFIPEVYESTNSTSSVMTLPFAPVYPSSIRVFKNGVRLHSPDFSVSGSTITTGISRTATDYFVVEFFRL